MREIFNTQNIQKRLIYGPNRIIKSGYLWDTERPVVLMHTKDGLQNMDDGGETWLNEWEEPYGRPNVIGSYKRNYAEDCIFWLSKSKKP